VEPVSLVHGMQNHDELTYELVHWATLHQNDVYTFRGEDITGGELAQRIRQDLVEAITEPASDYNLVFTTNGIACTTASLIAATRGHATLDSITDADIPAIRDAHLLLAAFNAWQPGVFALSGWDLLGALTLPRHQVADLIADGDTRWVERGAHDLLGTAGESERSASGMPRARSLYGSLPEQLRRRDSFASRLRELLRIRSRYGIATARQVDVPDVAHPGMLVMVHELETLDDDGLPVVQLTVLNMTAEAVDGTVRSDALPKGAVVTDAASRREVGTVDNLQSFPLRIGPYGARFLVLKRAAEE
jgi:trehalose synthase